MAKVQAAQSRKGRAALPGVRRVHNVTSVPPPVGGLNFAAPINGMEPQDAILLDNWICTRFGLSIRNGWAEHVTGLGNSVHSLMPWVGAAPSEDALFAATDDGIYDVTVSTQTPDAALIALSGNTGAGTMHSVNFQAGGANFLIACSEADGYHRYDPVNGWVKVASGGGAGQVDVVDPADLVHSCSWKRRLWFVERDSSSIWYLPVLAVAGTAVELDVGPQLTLGGHVTAVVNWTMDAGEGIDDHLVILGSEGDVIIYKGTDPSDASKFSIVGRWVVGALPQGRRSVSQYGGDVLIVSRYGLAPLSSLVKGGKTATEADPRSFVSRIQEVLRKDVQERTGRGWEVTPFDSEALLLINVPEDVAGEYKQYVLDTHSLRWSTFSNIPAQTFAEYKGGLYFGTADGRVCRALVGELDGVSLESGPAVASYIQCSLQTAFNYFDSPGRLKKWLLVRPTFISSSKPGAVVKMNSDFNTTLPSGIPGFSFSAASEWDTAVWDQSVWVGNSLTFKTWMGVEGVGYAGSLSMVVVGVGGSRLSSIDYMVEPGGPI